MKLSPHVVVSLLVTFPLLVGLAPASQAQVSLTFSGGLNVCIDDEPGDCSRIEKSGLVGAGVFYKVLPKLDVGLDLRFGALEPQENAANVEQGISTLHLMPTAVWSEPINEMITAEGRVGFGYGSNAHSFESVTGAETEQDWVSWATLALGVAVSMELQDGLEAGIGMDLYLQDGGTMCTETTGTACRDHEDPMHELFSTVLFARTRL